MLQSPLPTPRPDRPADEVATHHVAASTPGYLKVGCAFFLAGFATFSLIYCVQPLLVSFTREFKIGAAQSSLALSLTTGFLAASILVFGALSETLGRRGLMLSSMTLAGLLNIAAALSGPWAVLLCARALEGFALGGVPAVAMAYLAEEIDPKHLGLAMGLYIGGTAFGGMVGRVGIGFIADATSWRQAMADLSLLDLLAAAGFFLLLPPSRNFKRQPQFDGRRHLSTWITHLRNRELLHLFLIGALLMGAFVTVYNYVAFRLIAPPFNLRQSQISLIFLTYLFGMGASSAAGALADRYGRPLVLIVGVSLVCAGLILTAFSQFSLVIGGITVLTVGFFMSHSVASGWVGRSAKTAKGHAASLYLLAYYLGASILGSIGGWFWGLGGWSAVVCFTGALILASLAAAMSLHRTRRRWAGQAEPGDRRAS